MNNFTRGLMTCLLTLGLALAVPMALTVSDDVYAAPGGGGGKPKTEKCSNGRDDDGDGLIDCADPDCSADPACQAAEICDNGIDDDGDGLIDCADSDCTGDPSCQTPEICDDGIDNDGDGDVDCADSDCTGDPSCQQTTFPESCNDGVDNDGDGMIDCADYADCVQAVSCQTAGQNQFNIMMNYELGMHCTGFEFAYCCVLPPYNSILAQVVKTDKSGGFPRMLQADHSVGIDFLGRPTVVRDKEVDANGNFRKYMLRYWHDAQPRNDDLNGTHQSSTLISSVEGNSLLMWNTLFDGASVDGGNRLQYSDGTDDCTTDSLVENVTPCSGSVGVLRGDRDFNEVGDNYASAWLNHFYIYGTLEGTLPDGTPVMPGADNPTSAEIDKIRLGLPNAHVAFSTELPDNSGPAFHPMGPGSTFGLNNVLTFSTDLGTVVFTQMKLLENLPVMLTSPRIWEALGLPLTPFEDTIHFFNDPGAVDEDSLRPYVAMKAQLHEADCVGTSCTPGAAVLDDGHPVIGFGTAPIDIPNCERCHSDFTGVNSAQNTNRNPGVMTDVQTEMDWWNNHYNIGGGSDWYSRLKGAAISILSIHDLEHGTSFTDNWPGSGAGIPQNTRLGHESVVCQRCHADNVIAVVKSAACGPSNTGCAPGDLIPPLTEAMHYNHRSISECEDPADLATCGDIDFADATGRDGGCQGCHPAHRSDGDMNNYPITEDGSNAYALGDNRDAAGGCFVGRDVHSNRGKDDFCDPLNPQNGDACTPSHLNPVGQWQFDNVASSGGSWDKGIWCTNCHQQFSQEVWKAENVTSLVHAQPGDPGHVREPAGGTLGDVISAVNTALGKSYTQSEVEAWLDPGTHRATDETHRIWAPDPGLCAHAANLLQLAPPNPDLDGNVATIEINLISGDNCTTSAYLPGPDCFGTGSPSFYICGDYDSDGPDQDRCVGGTNDGEICTNDTDCGGGGTCAPYYDAFGGNFNVNLYDFCTTPDCVTGYQAGLDGGFHYGDPSGDDPDTAFPEHLVVEGLGQLAVPVPFSAATDGRDHWLSAGEPHCADCHAAPYVEQSGNKNFFPPFNYPRKASLNRYSRGHQDITCQGCHESIHGLYPVTPNIDTTSYAQAASMNHDGSHGPLKCGACHQVNQDGVYVNPDSRITNSLEFRGTPIDNDFDAAVSWMHTFTAEEDPADFICQRCHGDNKALISSTNRKWTDHAYDGRVSRVQMDRAEIANQGYISGDPAHEIAEDTVCKTCHGDRSSTLKRRGCTDKWKNHLIQGRASEVAWEAVTHNNIGAAADGTLCGW